MITDRRRAKGERAHGNAEARERPQIVEVHAAPPRRAAGGYIMLRPPALPTEPPRLLHRFFEPAADQPPIHRIRSRKTDEHADLHHQPIRGLIRLEMRMENTK